MPFVRRIGPGYYGIETEGINISAEVSRRIKKAFRDAMAIPEKKLNVQPLRRPSAPRVGKVRSQS